MRRCWLLLLLISLGLMSRSPEAATKWFSDDFESGTGQWSELTSCDITTARPFRGSNSLAVDGESFTLCYKGNFDSAFPSARIVYLSWWSWWANNYDLGSDGHGHWWRFESPDWNFNALDVECWPDTMRPINFFDGGGEWSAHSTPFTYRDGTWHHYEVYIDQGDSNVSNGTFRLWVDGTLVMDRPNQMMRNTAVTIFGDWLIASNVGAGVGEEPYYIDDAELWEGGCPASGSLLGGVTPTCAAAAGDTAPPAMSAGAPSGTLTGGTTSTEIRLTATDATGPITCKWDTTNIAYASMANTMDATGCSGGSTHCDTRGSLSDGGSYTSYVRCQDSVSPTPNTNTSSLTISFSVASGSIPSAPTGLTITTTAPMSLGLGWNSSSGATGYRLYQCHTSGSCTPTVVVVDQAGITYTHLKLVPLTGYRYTITAYNGNGESAPSSVVTGTTTQVGIAASYPADVNLGTDGRVIWYEPFDGYANIAALAARYDDTRQTANMSFQSDIPTNAAVGSGSVQFTAQASVSTPLLYQEFPATSYDQVFLRYYVKFTSGDEYGHSSIWLQGYDPLEGFPNPQAGTCNVNGRMVAAFENSTPSQWDAYLYWPTMHEDGSSECWGNEIFNDARPVTFDAWHSVEVMIKLNSAPYSTTNDGEYAVWLDGVKIGHYGQGFPAGSWSGGNFNPGGGGTFEGFRWRVSAAPTINNIWIQHFEQVGLTTPSTMLYDQVVVATEYIGPLAAATGPLPPAAPANLRLVTNP